MSTHIYVVASYQRASHCSADIALEGKRGRLQGELAITRAFGDVQYRQFGLISEPEVSAWHSVDNGDDFLVLASDGLYEALSTADVCHIAAAVATGETLMDPIDDAQAAL